MRHTQVLLSAAACGVLFALTSTAFAQSTKPGAATIVRIQGEARYSLGDGNWRPLVVGKVLAAGAIVQTAHDAMVDMVLGKTVEMPQAAQWPDRIAFAPDANVRGLIDYRPTTEQNMIRLTGDTMLAIDKLTVSDTGLDTVSDTELDLKQGRIFASVKKLSGASQYLIKIPNGIAGVRGTLFWLDADGSCGVLRGSMLLSIMGSNGTPVTHLVGEGNQFNSQTGQITPLSAALTATLQETLTALDTLYVELVSFTFDRTQCYISPIHGHHGHHGGGGGGGGGGGE